MRNQVSLLPSSLSDVPLGRDIAPLQQSTTKAAAVFFVVSLYFCVCIALAAEPANGANIYVFSYSHPSIAVLAIGIAIMPTGLIWIALLAFAACYFSVDVLLVTSIGSDSWSAMGSVRGLIVASLTGLAAGVLGRMLAVRFDTAGEKFSPELVALATGGALAIAGALIGGIALWLEILGAPSEHGFPLLLATLVQRAGQLGLVTAASVAIFQNLPTWRDVPELLLWIFVYFVLGTLGAHGVYEPQAVDGAVLSFAIVAMRPAILAAGAVLCGLPVFILLTGLYVDYPKSITEALVRDDLITNVVFTLIMLMALEKMRSVRIERIQKQTLGRMVRAQELARFGYFLFDLRSNTAFFDPLSRHILRVPSAQSEGDFLRRVHPDDRTDVIEGTRNTKDDGASFSFRFTEDGVWEAGAPVRFFSGFTRHESLGEDHGLTYGIVVDVTREHAQEEHLRDALQELSKRQGEQTQLFSMISHELRTPAAILSMLADELDEGRQWSEKGQEFRIVLEQLISILSDMRQTVRPEQNLPVKIEAFVPRVLAEGIATAFRPMAETKGIAIRVDVRQTADQMRASDRLRITQTLSNLVKNAIIHSQATEIEIQYKEQGVDPVVGTWTISDNGRNIPVEALPQLFLPFSRRDGSAVQSDGSGLGLFIAYRAIELLGGKLEYIRRPTSGAVFQITLPFVPLDGLHVSDPVANMVAPAFDLKSMSVLIVEDSEAIGELMERRFTKVFASVTWKRNGEAGLDWALKNNPDLIISDLFMPQMGGDKMAQKLRSGGYSNPILGMSAGDMEEDIERFRAAGANAVLIKPVRVGDVETALGQMR